MSIDFVSNITNNHSKRLISLIHSSDEIWIATAFLKTSGLNLLLPAIKQHLVANKSLYIIAGQNFALTEPAALHTLRELFRNNPNAKLFLANANNPGEVFHPKLFMFRKNDDCIIVSGSANLTAGGLQNNIECSLLIKAKENDVVSKDVLSFMKILISEKYSKEASLLVIKQYETFYNKQKQHNRQSTAIPELSKSQRSFNYNTLYYYFKKYDNTERETTYKNKTNDYAKARRVLNEIADHRHLNKVIFAALLDKLVGSAEESRLWHSGSLFRLRRKVYPYHQQFQRLVKYIKNHANNEASLLFAKAKKIVDKIEGAGPNYITEIMMTYNSDDYANMNSNPLTVLRKKGGLNIKASSASYDGTDYKEYCEIIKDISKHLGLRNMLEADSFFNDIYWRLKKLL